MPRVFIPYGLRRLTDGAREAEVAGATLGEVVDNLEARFPGFRAAVAEGGEVRPGVAIVCGSYPAREGLLERVEADTEIHFVHAVSGGAR